MKWYLTLVFILLYSQVSFCHFEERKENTFLHLKKIPSTFTSNEIGVLDAVVCPGAIRQCPSLHSCCSVPGSDEVHCCPAGYSCENGVCQETRKDDVAALFPSTGANIVKCNDQYACPDRYTCCQDGSKYHCCPMSEAVCCPDQLHCCPQGYSCSKDGKTCSSGSDTVASLSSKSPKSLKKPLERLLEQIKGQYSSKKTLLLKQSTVKMGKIAASKSRDHDKIPVIKKTLLIKDSNLNDVLCPDGESECPDGNTCCKLHTGDWGCCPFPKAVCCDDQIHCCPGNTKCNIEKKTCDRKTDIETLLTKIQVWKGETEKSNIICPDGQSECPEGNTCCKLQSGQYGCCPLPKAVCCSDGVHCCPNGYTCDVRTGTCTQGSSSLPMVKKVSSSKRESAASNIVCPDGQSECPQGSTCCKLSSGEYGCCPLPKAVCCSDGVHCCPNGYTCDVSAGTCTQGSSSLPILKKMLALKQESAASNIVCPDGQSQCPDGNTCCKLSSGEYGCCPLPKAVCCSDGVHCCPNGYTCDVRAGTCTQGSSSLPLVKKMVALKQESAASNKVCPDGQSECPEGNTCCKLSSGEYGCCPLPNAVCCSDGVHCCPNGYTCDVSAGTCTQGSSSLLILKKMLALKQESAASNKVCPDGQSECPDGNTCCKLSSGEYGCCPLPNAVCCSDGVHCCPNGYTCDVSAGTCTQGSSSLTILKKMLALKQESAASNKVCPDGQSECPDGSTCCKLSSGEYGCCPLPNAVCCSDGVHCCPNGYTCDVSAGTCTQGSSSLPLVKKIPASKQGGTASNKVCPDGQSECPDGSTCCKLSSGEYGCCPLPNAVCCSDGVHCCPNGYTCDVSAGTCTQGGSSLPMVKKIPASKQGGTASNKVCPDGQSECLDGSTCCKLSSGEYGCCPLPNAVCCSDGVHCCPNGYTCDVSAGTCTQGSSSLPLVKKILALKQESATSNIVCPDGQSECPEGSTCCKLSSGEYGCCPLPKAVCCSDGVHCCPNGYTCDVSAGTCTQGSSSLLILKKMLALKQESAASNIVCPDGQSQCPDGNTCCKLSSGEYGCCPLPNAVCCSDGVHCCPNGYTCDVSAGTCTQGGSSLPMVKKVLALKQESAASNIVCPDGQSECPDGNTCCKLQSGQYGCCPLPKAVCCSDGEHCCPNGYTCDVSAGTCSQGSSSLPMVKKMSSSKRESIASNIVCPDGQSECPEGSTCCKLSSGEYGCCPLPKAVCCSDGVHCCPNGYTCDVSAGTCTQGDSSLPMVKKTPASKQGGTASNKVCPDGQSECPDGSTCCKLSSGEYGCCPLPKAVCCSDGVHCCPNGYTCDVSAGTCTQGGSSLPMVKKIPASKQGGTASNKVCPDGQSECPDGSTCCKLSSGEYGCCPLPNAVCCSDGEHCCPNGYTCDVSAGTCTHGSSSIASLKMYAAVQVITHIRAGSGIVCPDKQYQCPNGSTCCKVPSGTYGCCPLKNAVCCSDNIHCCPEGYTCDVKGGKCHKNAERIKMMHNVPSSRSIMEARQNYIKCPDGSSCLDYETCCELADGSYGCCPLPHAVCCEDHKHCCPSGYRCDLAAGMCVTGNVRLPMLKKIRSPRKQKTPRVNLDEKVRFVPSHVQDEYPVAKDLLQ